MAGWGLAVAAGAFWVGILLAGMDTTPTIGAGAVVLRAGDAQRAAAGFLEGCAGGDVQAAGEG